MTSIPPEIISHFLRILGGKELNYLITSINQIKNSSPVFLTVEVLEEGLGINVLIFIFTTCCPVEFMIIVFGIIYVVLGQNFPKNGKFNCSKARTELPGQCVTYLQS